MTEQTRRDADQEWNHLITRALREPVDDALPPGFAATVAARADAATQTTLHRDERWIQGALVACLALVALAGFGPDLVAQLGHIAVRTAGGPPAALQWSGAIGVCLVLTLLVEIWTRTRHAARDRVGPRSV
jgi:hypothetical protein